MSHPSAEVLALYSTSDVPWRDRLRLRRHLSHCDQCERQLSLFRASTRELKHQAASEALTGFEATVDWSRLEREMEGNIIVGVAAARCVDKVPGRRGLRLKFAVATGAAALFVLGWFTHVPSEQSARIYSAVKNGFSAGHPMESSWPVLKTQRDGIVVGTSAGSLTILHPASAVVSLSGASSVEARYIDDETGQVTINDVYGQ